MLTQGHLYFYYYFFLFLPYFLFLLQFSFFYFICCALLQLAVCNFWLFFWVQFMISVMVYRERYVGEKVFPA